MIVVIGILAAITIVAYNGIQQRATNNAITSAATQSIRAIQAYIAANGVYPGAASSCLTPTTGCVYGGTTVATNSTVNGNIASIGSLTETVPLSGHSTDRGISYHYSSGFTFNGNAQPVRVYYWIKGAAQKCGAPNVTNSGANAATTSTLGYTTQNGIATLCIVSISGPGV